ncbi:hypothetical protein EDD39_7675 [Kitasatospora cineracea]|uniref:Uncharacterized protein n=1 Tax=Kitasatospora cineracea TaxID=88074 RepID=A0A8G1U8R9_9ACTN|nr:hypothetical protein EDD39_7675 [Kitasatospora cineracea]
MVELAEPEGAVNVNASVEAATTAAESLGLELVSSIEHIDQLGWTAFSCNPSDLGLPSTVDGTNGHVIASAGGSLWEATAAGDLSHEVEQALRWESLVVRRPRSPDEIGRAQLWQHTLLDRTVAYFGENTATRIANGPTVLWLTGDDGELADCLAFWNVRALRPLRFAAVPMYLLPATQLKDWAGFPEQLASQLRRLDEFSVDVVMTSRSLDFTVLDEVAAYLGLHKPTEDGLVLKHDLPRTESLRTAPFTYLNRRDATVFSSFTRIYGEQCYVDVPVVQDKITLRFTSPVPFSSTVNVLIGFEGAPFAALPKTDSVARLVDRNARWRNGAIELATFVRQECRLELNVPTLASAGAALLTERTERYEVSEKGAVGVGLTDDAAMSVLSASGVLESIQRLTTPRTEHMAKALRRLLPNTQDDLSEAEREFVERWGSRSERVFKSSASLGYGTHADAADRLERLAGISWVERGLTIKCAACGISSFLPLSRVPERGPGTCPGCDTLGGYVGSTQGPTLFYRLDSRIDRASDQGVLPHLLTIAALSRRFERSWFLPGLDLWFPGQPKKSEADLFGIADGKVITGEVKASGASFTEPGQIEKDLNIAAGLNADIYVMAAITPIPNDAQTLAEARSKERGIEIMIMGPAELCM